ncbi:MAG: hypothetical protein QOF60_245 [Actinomycetota bacterium]|jgi:glycosyltransferase involved in cell wall biosynthesis|nr:hypothetical protein [Actinomycetota bacterium]
MKIVAVTSRSPWPPNRGDRMRLSGFLAELASSHEVACCVARLSSDDRAHLTAMGVEPVAAETRLPSPSSFVRDPLQVAAFSRWRVPASLVREADVVHLSTVRAGAMVDDFSHAHLDYVDALSRNTEQRAASTRPRAFWLREARRLRTYEVELGRRVRSSSCTSDDDRIAIGLPDIDVVPFGVRVPDDVPEPDGAPTILFPGNLGYFANIDAAVWLATSIFPTLRRAVPNAHLVIAGARPSSEVRALGDLDGIEVHADVPSMTPFFGRSWVVAAPLRYGTGLQTKVLEGFAHRRAVVTTTAVAGRVPGAAVGVHLEAADDTPAIAALLAELLGDRARRERLAAAGLGIARSLSWEACTRLLEAAYRR